MRKTLLQTILAAFCAILCATSMGGGGMRRRMMACAAAPHEVLEYLESNGNQWIDTGVKPTANSAVEFRVSISTAADFFVFGCRGNNPFSSESYTFTAIASSGLRLDWIGNGDATYNKSSVNEYVVSANSGTVVCNGTSYAVLSKSPTDQYFYLFASNKFGQLYSGMIGHAWYFKIYDGSTAVRDFIPVLKDGVPCMYDKVSGGYFYNQVTGHQFGYKKQDGTVISPT